MLDRRIILKNICQSFLLPFQASAEVLGRDRESPCRIPLSAAAPSLRPICDALGADDAITLPKLEASFFANPEWFRQLHILIDADFSTGQIRLLNGWVVADHEVAFCVFVEDEKQNHAA